MLSSIINVSPHLSDKYDLKKTGSVIGTIKSITNTWITTYDDRLKGSSDDEDYVYMIQQLHVRIKSFIKNTAEAYYRCYNNKDYLTYDSDDMSQDNFRLTENDSTKIEAVTQRTLTYITSHDVDYRICKMCSDSNIKTEEIKSIIESIVKNTDNIDDIADSAKNPEEFDYFDDLVDRNLLTSFRETAKALKIKEIDGITIRCDSIASLPEHCVVDNTNQLSLDDIDLNWYISEAYKRINDFKGGE